MNSILRYTLIPKLGDDKMIHGYSINMLIHLDDHTRITIMDLIVETVRKVAANQKCSYCYAPYIQMLINSKMEKHIFTLDHPHLSLRPEFEDNEVVMDPSHPTAATTHAEEEAARDTSAP